MPKAKNNETSTAYVIDGQYGDEEWREIAATSEGERTKKEQARYLAGPKAHPFGADAFQAESEVSPGVFETRWYENREAYDRHTAMEGKVSAPEPSASNPAPLQAELDRKSADSEVRRQGGSRKPNT
jgi:hypothetical protein